jgi:hypothetical protein
MRKAQAATAAALAKIERGAATLASRLEERERERAARRGADAEGFASVKSA